MQNLSVVMVDAGGGSGITLLHLTDAAILTDGIVALLAASNADWSVYWGSTALAQSPVPTAAPYQSVKDFAELQFLCADSSIARVQYRAPVAAMFQADQETVDPADPTGVLALLLSIITSATGSPATSFVGGTRSSR